MSKANDSGFALVAVLCWAILLALASGAVVIIAQSQVREVKAEEAAFTLSNLADAGIGLALLGLLTPKLSDAIPINGQPFVKTFAGSYIRINVMDEGGKLDLNFASRPKLIDLLLSVGLKGDSAQSEADRILDWRERGAPKRLNGAKQDDYSSAGYRYGPRESFFQSPGELQLVMGMSEEVFRRVEPRVTVFSQEPDIDPSVAGFSGGDTSQSDLMSVTSGAVSAPLPPETTSPMRVVGHVFTISAEVTSNGYYVKRVAVVRVAGSFSRPVWVYRWY